MWYIILYILFFIAQLLYGSWHVLGPVTPRHIMTIIMFLVCIREGAYKRDKYMPFFFVFVFLFLLVGVVGGFVEDSINKCLAYYFVSVVAYYSTLLLLEKYQGGYYFILTLLGIGILNSIVTIGNMYMMPWATQITDFLHLSGGFDITDVSSRYHENENLEGLTVSGLLADVGNGYFMAYLSVLALYSRDKKIHLYNLILYVLFIIALFFIQERTGLVAGLVLSLYGLFRVFSMKDVSGSRKGVLFAMMFVVVLALVLPLIYNYVMSGASRYATLGMSYDEKRIFLNDTSLEFLRLNPMGGFYLFFRQYQVYPHNLIFNALIYGGIIGGICIFILLIKQVGLLLSTVLKRLQPHNFDFFIFSLMFLVYNICSLTHNQSVVTGDPTFWVLWALCLYTRGNGNLTLPQKK